MFSINRTTKLILLASCLILGEITSFSLTGKIVQAQTPEPSLSDKILNMERGLETEFETFFHRDLAEVNQGSDAIAQTLSRLAQQTNTQPAVLWVIPKENFLHLVLITPEGTPIVKDLYDVPKALITQINNKFIANVTNSRRPINVEIAQQLYNWIIKPFEQEYLQPQGIDTILFCLGDGLRGLPFSALYDGEQFLIEKYNLTRIPAFNLINTNYQNIQQGNILAMGASEFQEQNPLPAVPLEISNIIWEFSVNKLPQQNWRGISILNQDFTIQNLSQLLNQNYYNIVHLATHADFKSGSPDQSYIQFSTEKLNLDQVTNLNWNNPPVDLLVLSACTTALGDPQAELGFAGLALQSGVKSVLGSLWYVSDTGTLALMSEFYHQIKSTTTKAEALRKVQIMMLKGEIYLEGNQLILSNRTINLPEYLSVNQKQEFSHPYYWASFSLISSPW